MISDEALFRRLARGDRRAFDELYRRHVDHLFRFAVRYLADAHEAEDVVHDAFMALLRDGGEPRHVRAWLFGVARNLCLNRLRARRRAAAAVERSADETPAVDPAQELTALERGEALACAVGGLPDRLAELYRLRASGLSYRELADTLGVPVGTVKSRMHEMVNLLRSEVA